MEFDKMLQRQSCGNLVAKGKWDEAMVMIQTLEKNEQNGILRSLAFFEWQKGNFDNANEAIAIAQTEQMKKQITDLQGEFNRRGGTAYVQRQSRIRHAPGECLYRRYIDVGRED